MVDANGALFGTTQSGGGKNLGTVFKLTPAGSGYVESILHGFKGGKRDGAGVANLIEDDTGALYGTTLAGGQQSAASGCTGNQSYQGCGVVFKLSPSHSTYKERVIYSFQGSADGYDGYWPYGGLLADASGKLYGTTTFGGSSGLLGSVFQLTPSGNGSTYSESIIYTFPFMSNPPNFADGIGPTGSLLADGSGAFYGTSPTGGNCPYHYYACGVVYKLTPSASGYTESVLYSFQGGTDGFRLGRSRASSPTRLVRSTELPSMAVLPIKVPSLNSSPPPRATRKAFCMHLAATTERYPPVVY